MADKIYRVNMSNLVLRLKRFQQNGWDLVVEV
jgi:hypothetical protein